LGDPNRPTKIAEIYSEIYDNEWTDALDFCLQKLGQEYREDDVLQALNKTLSSASYEKVADCGNYLETCKVLTWH
jgi:hypothetical protein